MTVSKNMFGY